VGITATDEEAEELRKVAVSGVQSVESDGRKVVYRSLDDQLRVLGEVQASSSSGTSKRRRLAVFRSGW
jgi:hypothetical protein